MALALPRRGALPKKHFNSLSPMGRLDLPDRWRDEDDEEARARVASWKESYADGTAGRRADIVLASVKAGTWVLPGRRCGYRRRKKAA